MIMTQEITTKEKTENLLRDFEEWAVDTKRLKPGPANDYKSYLRTFPEKYNNVINSSKNCTKNKKILQNRERKIPCDLTKVLYILELFKEAGDRLYVLSILRLMKDFVYEVNRLNEENISHLKDCPSAYSLLEDYFLEYNYCSINPLEQEEKELEKELVNEVRNNTDKNCLYHQLDGMSDLLTEFGEQKFFQLAINGSYFFCPDLVSKEKEKVKEFTTGTFELDKARNTTDKNIKTGKVGDPIKKDKKGNSIYEYKYCFANNKSYQVEIDPNGNRFVCDIINALTNLNLGSGKNCIIQNTIISHIWGRAYDPRYFRSLWNIALIPAWANSLMDKESATKKTLASKMRATCMAICTKLYKDSLKDGEFLKIFDLDKSPSIVNKKDVVKGKFTINIIKGKQNKEDKSVIIYKKEIELK